MNSFSYSYSRWRRLEVWQPLSVGVHCPRCLCCSGWKSWLFWNLTTHRRSTMIYCVWSFCIFYPFSHKMNANFKFICIDPDIEHALVTLFNTVWTVVGYLLSIRNNNIWVYLVDFSSIAVAFVCSFSVKTANQGRSLSFSIRWGWWVRGRAEVELPRGAFTGVP